MDAPTADQLISTVPSLSEVVCLESSASDLVQLEQHGSNTDFIEPETHRVILNKPGTADISDGESFITAPEYLLRHSTNSAIESNRSHLVQNGPIESYKEQAEGLAIFQDIKHALCKQLHQLQLTIFEAVSYPHATIPHLHMSASICI